MPRLAMFTDTVGSNLISTNRILALVTASQMACSLHAPTDQYRW
jgi:hypothetical protein